MHNALHIDQFLERRVKIKSTNITEHRKINLTNQLDYYVILKNHLSCFIQNTLEIVPKIPKLISKLCILPIRLSAVVISTVGGELNCHSKPKRANNLYLKIHLPLFIFSVLFTLSSMRNQAVLEFASRDDIMTKLQPDMLCILINSQNRNIE